MRYKKYILYFVLVVLAGGSGCWISLIQYCLGPDQTTYGAFIGNIATFSISVAFLALADQIIITDETTDSTIGLLLLIFVIATSGLSAFSMLVTKIDVTNFAIVGFFIALACWCIVNVKNRSLVENIEAVSALGGDLK